QVAARHRANCPEHSCISALKCGISPLGLRFLTGASGFRPGCLRQSRRCQDRGSDFPREELQCSWQGFPSQCSKPSLLPATSEFCVAAPTTTSRRRSLMRIPVQHPPTEICETLVPVLSQIGHQLKPALPKAG